MKKVVFKEIDKNLIILDIMLYSVFVVTGFILLNFSDIELLNPIRYASPLFYMFGFFSLLVYFLNRQTRDYELLIFGFINVCVGAFIMIYVSFPDTGFIMADAVLVYSIANVVNKGYTCKELMQKKDINFFVKLSVTILLLLLGVFVVSSLYNKIEVGSLILGYYFIIFGLLSLLEPLMSILINNVKIERYFLDVLSYDKDIEDKDVKKVSNKSSKKEEINEKPKKTIKSKQIKKINNRNKTKK